MHFFNHDESAGHRIAASTGGPALREGMMLERIQSILETCETDTPLLPRTELYNEGWLLRLVLDWYSAHQVPNHLLSFDERSHWFSEAWLPSAFLQGPQRESWTHADGVIGHFTVGEKGKAALSLRADATHFVVLEAKLFSRLASGVTHAPYYDQAARTVACIAEVLRCVSRRPHAVSHLGFYVLAPRSQIQRGVFAPVLDRNSIGQKVQQRVQEYDGEREEWYAGWFQPTWEQIEIDALSWEDVIETIGSHKPATARALQAFYRQCLEHNQSLAK
jgi:hypothetical protein